LAIFKNLTTVVDFKMQFRFNVNKISRLLQAIWLVPSVTKFLISNEVIFLIIQLPTGTFGS